MGRFYAAADNWICWRRSGFPWRIWPTMNFWRKTKMKETKKSEEAASRASAIRKALLDRAQACGQQRAILTQLEGWLSEHSKAMQMRALRVARLSPEVQRLVQNGSTRCIVTPPTELAEQLLAGKTLAALILEERKVPQLKQFYSSLNFNCTSGPDVIGGQGDLEVFLEWDFERAAVQILKAAITSQKKIAVAETKISMEKFSRTVAKARAETARELLACLAEMRRIVESDQALATGLEKDEIEALRPKPFPLQIVSSDAIAWLLDAVSEKMIGADELSGLQLETVSPEPREAKAEPAA